MVNSQGGALAPATLAWGMKAHLFFLKKCILSMPHYDKKKKGVKHNNTHTNTHNTQTHTQHNIVTQLPQPNTP